MKLVEEKKDNLNRKKPTREEKCAASKGRARAGLKGARARCYIPDSVFCNLERARAGSRPARARCALIFDVKKVF